MKTILIERLKLKSQINLLGGHCFKLDWIDPWTVYGGWWSRLRTIVFDCLANCIFHIVWVIYHGLQNIWNEKKNMDKSSTCSSQRLRVETILYFRWIIDCMNAIVIIVSHFHILHTRTAHRHGIGCDENKTNMKFLHQIAPYSQKQIVFGWRMQIVRRWLIFFLVSKQVNTSFTGKQSGSSNWRRNFLIFSEHWISLGVLMTNKSLSNTISRGLSIHCWPTFLSINKIPSVETRLAYYFYFPLSAGRHTVLDDEC